MLGPGFVLNKDVCFERFLAKLRNCLLIWMSNLMPTYAEVCQVLMHKNCHWYNLSLILVTDMAQLYLVCEIWALRLTAELHILVSWNSAFPSLMLTTFYSGFLGTICAFTGSSIINFSHRVFCFTVICNFAISCYWCHAVANTQLMRILVPFILHRKDTVLLKPGI